MAVRKKVARKNIEEKRNAMHVKEWEDVSFILLAVTAKKAGVTFAEFKLVYEETFPDNYGEGESYIDILEDYLT